MNARTSRILLPILAAIAVAAIVPAILGSIHHVHEYADDVRERFELRSRDSLFTFAKLSRTALLRGDVDSLGAMASLLLDSSATFVQIIVGEREVIANQREETDVQIERFPFLRLEPDSITTIDSPSGILDLAIPIESADAKPEVVGYTRIAFDRASSARLILARKRLAIGLNAALILILFAPLIWFARRPSFRPSSHRQGGSVSAPQQETIVAGPVMINSLTKEVWIDGCAIHLTPKQLSLLIQIARSPNRVFSDDELIAAIWSTSAYASAADVKQCVYTLRKRLAKACDDPSALIVNVQGYGYKLAIAETDRNLTES